MEKTAHSQHQRVLRDLLRQIREEAGLRQIDLANRLNEPQSFVSKYESGERRLDLIELRQICQAMEVSLPDLIARFEDTLNEAR